jgi:hypothetical protein
MLSGIARTYEEGYAAEEQRSRNGSGAFRLQQNYDRLGPLPKPFEVTKVLAEASLRGAVQYEAEPVVEERRERCAQYLGGTSIDDYISATLGMLEATTPPADPHDATIFDDYDALKEGY